MGAVVSCVCLPPVSPIHAAVGSLLPYRLLATHSIALNKKYADMIPLTDQVRLSDHRGMPNGRRQRHRLRLASYHRRYRVCLQHHHLLLDLRPRWRS